ncbi:MAG TPA: YbaK/EbsC family protein [Povalibacter sp.]|nr:YbaK/EbsC family protein [Povalibacter sp.]
MTIAASVAGYLSRAGVPYDVIAHTRTSNSSLSAEAAHVPGDQLAKCVMLEDDGGYVMAVVPASRRVDLGAIHERLGRSLGLATEGELARLFADCEPGAAPPLGNAYGIDCIVDDGLAAEADIYFEGGDHRALVHVSGRDFLKLMGNAPRERISH